MQSDRDLLSGPIARRWVLCGERPSKDLERYPSSWLMPSFTDDQWTVSRGLLDLSWFSKREWYEMFCGTMLLQKAHPGDEFAARADGRRRLAWLWEHDRHLCGVVFVGLQAAQSVAWRGGETPEAGEWRMLDGIEFYGKSAPATWLPLPLRMRHPAHVANTLFHEFFQRLREASAPQSRPPWDGSLQASRW